MLKDLSNWFKTIASDLKVLQKKLILKARHTTKVHWKIVLTHKFLSLESLLSSLGCFPKHSTALNLKTAIVVAYRDDGSC